MDPLYIQPHFPFLQVSILGYGCMGLTGIYNNPLPKEEGSKVLKEAFNRGVTFFDTVDVYGVQHANEILVGKGKFLVDLACHGDKLFQVVFKESPHVHRVLADIVSASANATPGLGRYPPFEREVVTITTTALEGYKNDAKAMSLNEKDYYTFWIAKYDHDSSYVSLGLPDNKDCSLITKIQKVDKYPTLNQPTLYMFGLHQITAIGVATSIPENVVWAIADSGRQGFLGFKEFITTMQLISMAQVGHTLSSDLLNSDVDYENLKPPVMDSLDVLLAKKKRPKSDP
ncbi:hypothetical protein Lser_V15G03442 [Lactuca serriola]